MHRFEIYRFSSSIERQVVSILNLIFASLVHFSSKCSSKGWAPNPDSRILKIVSEVYKQVLHKDGHVRAIHAGLECGILADKVPGIDSVSFGPQVSLDGMECVSRERMKRRNKEKKSVLNYPSRAPFLLIICVSFLHLRRGFFLRGYSPDRGCALS